MIVSPCTIKDLNEVETINSVYYGSDMFMWSRGILTDRDKHVFKMEDNSAIVLATRVDKDKASLHFIGAPSSTKAFKDFVILSTIWLFENTNYKYIIGFIDKSNKRMRMFLGNIGAEISGTLNTLDCNEDIIYSLTKSKSEQYKRRLSWVL